MAEPVSSTASAYGVSKLAIASGLGAVLAAVVVMTMAYPKTKREFIAALVATLATSIFGGAALIDYFDFNAWSHIAQGGAYFLCGLPAWVGVRAFFAWSESNKDKTLLDLIKQIREAFSKSKD